MRHAALRIRFGWWQLALAVGLSVLGAADGARAEEQPSGHRIVVTGEGKVGVTPDIAQIRSGVTTRGKTVREATEANSKLMAAILTALTESGIGQNDVETAQLSIQPVYASPEPGKEQKLIGYSVGNHVSANIKHIEKLGDVLDRMIAAGATEIWNVQFLVSDPGKALDQAREAAIADARRKAGVYARAAGVTLGRVVSIEEESGSFAPVPKRALAQPAGTQIPIAPGENTLTLPSPWASRSPVIAGLGDACQLRGDRLGWLANMVRPHSAGFPSGAFPMMAASRRSKTNARRQVHPLPP